MQIVVQESAANVIAAGKVPTVTNVLPILTAPTVIVANHLNVSVLKVGPEHCVMLVRNG